MNTRERYFSLENEGKAPDLKRIKLNEKEEISSNKKVMQMDDDNRIKWKIQKSRQKKKNRKNRKLFLVKNGIINVPSNFGVPPTSIASTATEICRKKVRLNVSKVDDSFTVKSEIDGVTFVSQDKFVEVAKKNVYEQIMQHKLRRIFETQNMSPTYAKDITPFLNYFLSEALRKWEITIPMNFFKPDLEVSEIEEKEIAQEDVEGDEEEEDKEENEEDKEVEEN